MTSSASSSGSRRRGSGPTDRLVLLDTNALFLPVRSGFPLEREVDRLCPGSVLGVLSSTLRELDRLMARATPEAPAARALARQYVRVAAPGRGDAAVVAAALRLRATVVTADRGLRRRLTEVGAPVLYPRDRHRLERFSPETPRAPPKETPRARHGFKERTARHKVHSSRRLRARR